MDVVDDKILEKLNHNTRKNNNEIAKELNISLTSVSNRIKKTKEENVTESYIPLLNQEKIGYDLTVVINVKISHAKFLEVQERISKDKQVSSVYNITGD